jgi:geranylgeranyl diphosphate synthase type II
VCSLQKNAKEAFAVEISNMLDPYKERFEPALVTVIDRLGARTGLREACAYALQSGGKRFRPALVYMVADALHSRVDVTCAALSVEFFHTASLIADDLPCMDNDDFRRGRPTTHKVYGEATALLASLALIALGFEYIAYNAEQRTDVCDLALLQASRLNGVHGLIGGQYLDLFSKELTKTELYEIIKKKTVALFELSFVLGWLFGGGPKEQLGGVQTAAFHFGAAFQILDDLDDMEKDAKSLHNVNFANLFGQKEAIEAVRQHTVSFQESLKAIHLDSRPLFNLAEGMGKLYPL